MSTRLRAYKLVEAWNNAWPGIQIKATPPNPDYPRLSHVTAGEDLVERIALFMKDEISLIRAERKDEVDRLKARIMELVNK